MKSNDAISKYIKIVDQSLNNRKLRISEAKPTLSNYNIDDNDLPKLDPSDPVHYASRYEPDKTQSYEQDFDKESIKREIQSKLNLLNKKEKLILKLRYWDGMTSNEISDKTGFSDSIIRSIEKVAFRKLRNEVYHIYNDDYYYHYNSDELPKNIDSAIENYISKIRKLITYCNYPIKSQGLKQILRMPEQVSNNLSYQKSTFDKKDYQDEVFSIISPYLKSMEDRYYQMVYEYWIEEEIINPGYVKNRFGSIPHEQKPLEQAFKLLHMADNEIKLPYIDELKVELPKAAKAIRTGVEKYGIKDFSKKFNLTPDTINWFLQQRQ